MGPWGMPGLQILHPSSYFNNTIMSSSDLASLSIATPSGEEADNKLKDDIRRVDEVYNEADADVTVVASDNMVFKVHRYFLCAAR